MREKKKKKKRGRRPVIRANPHAPLKGARRCRPDFHVRVFNFRAACFSF